MTKRSTSASPKVSKPRLHGIVARERLFARLNSAAAPVVWITAPAGAGKTSLVASYLDGLAATCLWYQLDEGDGDAATFFHFMQRLATQATGARAAGLPTLAAEQMSDVTGFARRWFRALFARLPNPAILTLDNFQDVAHTGFPVLVREALEQIPEGLRVILISVTDPPPALARLVANGIIDVVGPDELRFTREESDAVARSRIVLDAAARAALHERSAGWAAGLVLMIEHVRRSGATALPPRTESEAAVFDYFAGEIFDRLAARDQHALMLAAAPRRVTARLLQAMSGHPDAAQLLEQAHRRHLFLDRRAGAEPTYQFHALFRAFLRARARVLPAAERVEAAERAALLFEVDGDVEEAIVMHLEAADWSSACRLIVQHARHLYEQGRWRTLLDWIGALPEEVHDVQPWLAYWVGACQVFVDPPTAYRMLVSSHDRFESTGDVEGSILACGALTRASLLHPDWSLLDGWIARLEQLLDPEPGAQSDRTLLMGYSRLLYATLARRPQEPRQQRWAERALSLLGSDVDASEAVLAGFSLLTYFTSSGQTGRADDVVRQIEPLLADARVSPVGRAYWTWALANHRLRTGASDQALERMDAALELATNNGLTIAGVIRRHRLAHLLTLGRLDEAHRELQALAQAPRVEPYLEMRAWLAVLRGDLPAARDEAGAALRMATERGRSYYRVVDLLLLALIGAESGDFDAAGHCLFQYREIMRGAPGEAGEYHASLFEAYVALRSGDVSLACVRLRHAFAIGEQQRYRAHWGWSPAMMSRLVTLALEHDIGVPHARELIRMYGLAPASPDPPRWPWPVMVRTLGRFEIQLDGAPLRSAGKAQRKPLELLKVLIAHGERGVPIDRLVDLLWPDPEQGGRNAFESTLHRLRKLLHSDAAVMLTDGNAILDGRVVWNDATALARMLDTLLPASGPPTPIAQLEAGAARVLELYAGPFLAEEPDAPWLVAPRNRLTGRLERFVQRLGDHWQATHEWARAGELYQRAIDLDPLAESFYRARMTCLQAEGRRAEALEVFRRCRQMLSITLGIAPAPETEALYREMLVR
ncbi:MAG TPA: BTAD domain-containing putative transcriptional regulator [Casimicrobiaceae bacterium]|nr:BTAD domain-containing putative transcriptional regulator [Casimicrobiaceae bacterium]